MFELLFKYSRDDYARSDLIFASEWPAALLIAIGVMAALGITLMLFIQRRRASLWQLLAVWALQLAMVAVVLVLLLQPTLQTEQLKEGENTVALVVDRSDSMAYGEPSSRFDTALASLLDASSDESLGISPLYYAFAETSTPMDSIDEAAVGGAATSFAESILAVLDDARSQSLAAVILASDGVDTAGGVSAEQLAEIGAFGVPVHTIGVGRERITDDVEFAQLVAPARALTGSTVSARVAIRHDGAGEVRVKVYDGNELLASEPVRLDENATTTTAWIDLELAKSGYRELRFDIDGGADEPEQRNNRRSTLIKVEEQQFHVLYYEGEPRWEYKFMRRALDDEGDIRLATLLRVSPNKFYRQGLESAEQLEDGFPTTRDELFGYDALIIGSIEAASLSDGQLQLVRDFVSERGGTLLMIAGPNGLGNGGWGQSEIADLLPVRLPPSTTNSFVRSKASVRLTPQGADTQMLKLAADEDDNLRTWADLPEIADYQATGSLKPAARALLDVDTEDGSYPLLVTQPFGRGNVYILATGGTWRWQMSMPLEDESHERFWRQLVRSMVSSAPPRIALSAESTAGDTSVSLRAEFRDGAYRPMDGIGVSAVVSHEDGTTWTVPLLPHAAEPGVFVADTALDASGSWYFEALAERDGDVMDTARTSLYSESGQAEYFNIRRDAAFLARLSDATGGRYFEADDLAALPDLLRYSDAGVTEAVYRPVWDAPALFVLLLLLKTGEWLLRRRWRTI